MQHWNYKGNEGTYKTTFLFFICLPSLPTKHLQNLGRKQTHAHLIHWTQILTVLDSCWHKFKVSLSFFWQNLQIFEMLHNWSDAPECLCSFQHFEVFIHGNWCRPGPFVCDLWTERGLKNLLEYLKSELALNRLKKCSKKKLNILRQLKEYQFSPAFIHLPFNFSLCVF